MSKQLNNEEVNEETNMPVAYEAEEQMSMKEKAISFKEKHPKLIKGLKIGGIGLLMTLFGAGCYKLGSKKVTDNDDNGDYCIDLDKLEDSDSETIEE